MNSRLFAAPLWREHGDDLADWNVIAGECPAAQALAAKKTQTAVALQDSDPNTGIIVNFGDNV
jgi:hypothetical protein